MAKNAFTEDQVVAMLAEATETGDGVVSHNELVAEWELDDRADAVRLLPKILARRGFNACVFKGGIYYIREGLPKESVIKHVMG